ncbi:hypothetical protein C2S53_010924 [Perilla frutescens var. hirtella]|uniref:RING-type domain-containing protein n=1 Tax=Perilla frutescens var. hirtella TaxID=608512 RepID=A0AAD4J0D4_PERFH|nr:hypothetical protein C2S51_034921 [Perilla frutescens var. frutescens]KAH6824849.1 hypothetical protein C2S53_010924 [Perilla frutescens var. hirtella]
MTNFTTTNSTALPPSTAAHPHNSYMSPLTAILCLVALITIPMLSYTFFMAIRCRRSTAAPAAEVSCKAERVELVCGVKYRKTAAAAGSNGGEPCPVCLSVFAEGEEIRQLSACKHAFHAACVDMWLYSHSSCPVCRAAVPVKRSKRVLADGEDDFRQGLPDASSLI